MNNLPLRHRLSWVDVIRAIAMCMVIIVHVAPPFILRDSYASNADRFFVTFLHTASLICVPMFFMLTGFLLLQKHEPLPQFLTRRLPRIVIPLLVWSLIYLLWWRFISDASVLSVRSVIGIAFGPVVVHLWFLYALIGLYLFIPLLRYITINAPSHLLWYIVAIWFIAACLPLVPINRKLLDIYDLAPFIGNVGYLVLGLLLGRMNLKGWHAAAACLIYLLMIPVTWGLNASHQNVFAAMKANPATSYLQPQIIVMSTAGFLTLRYLATQWNLLQANGVQRALLAISTMSFGIYLSHALLLEMVNHRTTQAYLPFLKTMSPAVFTVVVTIVVLIASALLIRLIQAIPGLRRIAG